VEKKLRDAPTNFGLLLFLIVLIQPLCSQQNQTPLSPSESYKAALAPYNATRSQANDLTDADKFALGIGAAQAARDCLPLASDRTAIAKDAKELFALGQLCMFGQQFEPARAALVDYLALPQPPQREQALLLLVRALLALQQPESAEPQVDSLLHDYPYDPLIHSAINQVINKTEGASPFLNDLALQLCHTQSAATLPLLKSGKGLEGKDDNVPAAGLFVDALRCAELARNAGKPDNLEELSAIVAQPNWIGTSDLALMRAALEREKSIGTKAPISLLRGYVPGASESPQHRVWFAHNLVVLVAFTLWSPSTPEILGDLAKLAPHQAICAITSWQANTGRDDKPSKEVLDGLRIWQRSAPKRVSIMVVPDSVLKVFHSDVFPVGIIVRNGVVLSNTELSGEGAERVLMKSLH
jgi:hypothetical protein